MKRKSKQNRKLKYDLKVLEKEAAAICQDFTTFCGYITENKVKVAMKTGHIGKKDCFALNKLLQVREEYEKPNYLQNQYPVINFFYYVAVRYKILEVNSSGVSLQCGRKYQCFCEASAWEQYMLFLSVFLFDGMFAGKEGSWYADRVADSWEAYVDSFMEWVDGERPRVGCKCRLSGNSSIRYLRCLYYLTPYLEELNLIKVWEKPDSESWDGRYCWEIEALPLLEMVSDLYENTDIAEDTDEQEPDYRNMVVKHSYAAFMEKIVPGQPSGSLWRMFEKSDAQYQEQTIDLEVSVRYTDCIRVIRLNLKNSLYDLHRMIQKAVAFDDDHLFEFSIGNGMMKRNYTLSEAMNSDRELPVEGTRLGDLELCKGQKFTYLFDFGDMWWFDIKVLEIRDGMVETPEVIETVNDAPEQYPYYEEDMKTWQVEISEQMQISNILGSIEDDLIRDEYIALTGRKNGFSEKAPDELRHEMERILLENPGRMLLFMTAEMREMLSKLLQQEWIDGSEKCVLAKLYSFGFCKFPERNEDVISVPESIREIYSTKLKTAGKMDKLVDVAEVFLRRCGVMETQFLYTAVTQFLKRKISYEDFEFLMYSRLHYFGAYYCDCYHETEYMSCYDREMTQKILTERQKPENARFDYPDFAKVYAGELKILPEAQKNWNEYVMFHMSIDWKTAENLTELIPAMAASGVIQKEEIVAAYKEMLRGTGRRVTKKAEGLIDKMYTSMPLATRRGNTGQEEYTQLSIFDSREQ